jgi:TIR domain
MAYSTHDQEVAEQLHADLQAEGVRCWFAPHDIKEGRKIHEQIDEAIRLNDRLLLILSEHSMSSEWVNTEVAKARKREVKEGKRFDGEHGERFSAGDTRVLHPDFSNWKDHNSYQTAFQRLVTDLKAEASK